MGELNPVHNWSQETKQRVAKDHSIRMKLLIAEGKFTPNISNSRTHWECFVLGRKFRSSWEAMFWFHNQNLEYETIRIPYIGLDNKPHTYIVDFCDRDKNILYEVKPKEHIEDEKTKLKLLAARKWCEIHNFQFVLISQTEIMYLVETTTNFSAFNDELVKQYETYKSRRNTKS